jgi:iron complex outermembrane recepter protein
MNHRSRTMMKPSALLQVTLAGLACTAAPHALAQTAPAPPVAEGSAQTIVVSGSKIRRTLQDEYSSVGHVGARDIEQSQIRDYADAFRFTPNVRVGSSLDTGFVIRGINSQGFGVGAGALGTLYLDGVPQTQQSSRRGANGLWDTASVEVYRGPHSTLSGRNSLAGAIYVRSKDPTFTREAAGRAQVSDDDGWQLAAAYSQPINDKIAFRVSGSYARADDWHIAYPAWVNRPEYKNISTEENWLARAKLLVEPDGPDGMRALATASRAYYRIPRGTARGKGGIGALATLYGVNSVFDRVDYANSYLNDFNNEARAGEADNFSLEVGLPIAAVRGLRLTAISTYIDAVVFKPSINGREVQDGDEVEKESTQELRANYRSPGGAFEGVLGLYFLAGDETFFNDQPIRTATAITGRRLLTGETKVRASALFGEATWAFAKDWKLTAGGRINREKTDDQGRTRSWAYSGSVTDFRLASFTAAPASDTSTTSGFSESVFLPKLGVALQLNAERSVAFTVQKGYRGGGTGVDTTVNPAQRYTFDPETTVNYELAWRSTFAEGRGLFNANVFYTDWKDQQIPFRVNPTDPISRIVNAGRSKLSGAELELRYRPLPRLNVFANVGYTHTQFVNFTPPSNISFAGAKFPDAPLWNYALGADYETAAGWFVRGDLQYTGTYYSTNLNVRQTRAVAAGNYTVANLSAGRQLGPWRFTAFVRNLTDEDVVLFNGPLDDDVATFGRPRQIGFTVDLKF